MPNYRLYLISEPVAPYEFADPRPLPELSAAIARDGFCVFEGVSGRMGTASQTRIRQSVFASNIGRLIEQ